MTADEYNDLTPLERHLLTFTPVQFRRYNRLEGVSRAIATEGILRHLEACARLGVDADVAAVREIIDDALNGRAVYAETTK